MARTGTILEVLTVAAAVVIGMTACSSDSPANTAQTFVRVDGRPSNVVFAGGSVWVLDQDSGALSRIDPASKKLLASIPTGIRDGDALVLRGDRLWVSGRTVSATVDITTNRVAASAGRAGVAVGGRVFARGVQAEQLVELDPVTGEQRNVVVLPVVTSTNAQPNIMLSPFAADHGSLYLEYFSEVGETLGRFDPTSGSLTSLFSIAPYRSIAVAGPTVWLLERNRSLHGYDTTTGKPIVVPAGAQHLLAPVDANVAGLDEGQVGLSWRRTGRCGRWISLRSSCISSIRSPVGRSRRPICGIDRVHCWCWMKRCGSTTHTTNGSPKSTGGSCHRTADPPPHTVSHHWNLDAGGDPAERQMSSARCNAAARMR